MLPHWALPDLRKVLNASWVRVSSPWPSDFPPAPSTLLGPSHLLSTWALCPRLHLILHSTQLPPPTSAHWPSPF